MSGPVQEDPYGPHMGPNPDRAGEANEAFLRANELEKAQRWLARMGIGLHIGLHLGTLGIHVDPRLP